MELGRRDRGRDPGRLLAKALGNLLSETPVGAGVEIASSSTICGCLELIVPTVIAGTRPEWRGESVDGFLVERTSRTGARSVQVAGCCVLMSDEALSPFLIDLTVDEAGEELHSIRVRVGEPGRGSLGISGPKCGSSGADKYRGSVLARLDQIAWVYDCTA